MILKIISVFVYFNCVFGADYSLTNKPIVKTSSGIVKGLTINVLNQSIDQFLGIPFAEPPVGSLRFAKPKPISKPIEGIIDCTKTKYSCIQMYYPLMGNLTTSEDCLTLNIWSPKREDNNSTKLKPVMFWIYGGGLYLGSIFQDWYNGSALATHDIVFVSVNYRLGPLGFLYGGEDSAPGNIGFFDQLLGLKWVRENIHLFGGDKNQITIFGESAGSWSVSAQIISPLTKGLFQRAIMQSGAHLYNKDRPVLSKEEGLSKAKQLAKRVNCTDDKQWLECLRKVDAKTFVIPSLLSTDFICTVDGTEFLPMSAQKALMEPKDIDLMAGVNRNEGSALAKDEFPLLSGNVTLKQIEDFILFTNDIYHNIRKDEIMKYYFNKIDFSDSTAVRTAFYEFFGDILLKCPTYHFAKQFAKNAPKRNTFFYELTYQGTLAKTMGCDEKTMGICHVSELEFVFGFPFISKQINTELSVEFSREVMKMWTNFAKTGNPGDEWIMKMSHHGHSIVKILDPRYPGAFFVDPFENSCDGFWKDYFE